MLKKAVQQGRSERRGEEVRTALRVAVRPSNRSWRTEKPFQCSEYPRVLFNVEPLSDARTPLADFFSIPLEFRLIEAVQAMLDVGKSQRVDIVGETVTPFGATDVARAFTEAKAKNPTAIGLNLHG